MANPAAMAHVTRMICMFLCLNVSAIVYKIRAIINIR